MSLLEGVEILLHQRILSRRRRGIGNCQRHIAALRRCRRRAAVARARNIAIAAAQALLSATVASTTATTASASIAASAHTQAQKHNKEHEKWSSQAFHVWP